MAISHCYWYLVVKNGNFTLLLTSFSQEWPFHIATDTLWSRMAISHCYWHLVVKNCNFTLLLTSCGQEWQFHIATDICGQEWQFHIATDILWSRMAIGRSVQQIYPSKCIMGYILWDVFGSHFGFFKKKVGISFYFWIIRVVICQLTLYSHVRCKPHLTPLKYLKQPHETPPHDNFKFQLWELIFTRCNM